jgi:ABC-2 type transport system ATP-binding protein
MSHVIQTEDLSKHYGEVKAAESVNLQIHPGEIYGFLGLNGAGKTTTIRMLLGMIRPTRGKAYLFGKKVDPRNMDLWNKVGHMVEMPYSYPELTVLENLEIFYRLRFLKDPNLLPEIIDKLFLGQYQNIRVKNLSLGNVQRLGIAKAMIHRPDLLILDEPANGLDPAGIVQIREILLDLAQNHQVSIFISSHILGEISRLASRIGIIHQGHMILESDAEQLKNSRRRALHVNTADNTKASELLSQNGYRAASLPDASLELTDPSAMDRPENISALLGSHALPPKKLVVDEEDLEHYFFRIVQTYKEQA